MDTGGYGVLLTVTAEGGTEVDAAFSQQLRLVGRGVIARNCSRRTGSRKTSSSAETMQKGVRSRIGLCGHGAWQRRGERMQRKFRLSSLLHNMRLRWSPRRSKMAAAQTNSTLAAGIRARAHFDSVILPMWMGPGFNQALGLPFESLDAASGNPLPAERYRAMACARQLYVYVEASGPTRPRMPTACSSPCAPISRMRAAAGATAWTRRRVRWTRPRISIPTPSSCSPAPRISGARATPGRASSCWARRNHRGPLQAARRSVRSGCRFGLEPRCAARPRIP